MELYDAVVVGAGIMGSFTAYHLQKQGCRTLLVEQFPLPHTRGSSSSQTRIIRKAYQYDSYAAMMPEAFRLWKEIESESGITVLKMTGLLSIGDPDNIVIQKVRASMQRQGHPFTDFNPDEVRQKYPQLTFPDNHIALFDPSGGVLLADKCLVALRKLFLKLGGTIQDGQEVTDIVPGATVTVITRKSIFHCKKVVLTPGPWAKDLLKKLHVDVPYKTMPGFHVYWKDDTGKHRIADNFPVVMNSLDEKDGYQHYAAFPEDEYPGLMKITFRQLPPPVPFKHPDIRDRGYSRQAYMSSVSDFIRCHLPGVDDKPAIIEPCVYTMSPDGQFTIDHHPRHNNIIIGAGFSGHGFKLAPVVGKLLSELALERKTSYDVTGFKLSRFNSKLDMKSRL